MTARPIYEAVPLNEVTTPIEGQPDYRRTAEIKVVFGEKKIPVARISYEHFWNEEVGLNYYDAFEWLIRTKYKASQDNLIVEEITVAS